MQSAIRKLKGKGFTLIELLVVIVIIAILMALVTPAFYAAIMATKLTTAGGQLHGMLSNAQQIAMSEGCTIEVRFYKYANDEFGESTARYRSVLLMRHFEKGSASPDPTPGKRGKPLGAGMSLIIGEVLNLSQDMVITENPDMSSMLDKLPNGNTAEPTHSQNSTGLVPYEFRKDSSYKSFVFKPDGTNLNSSGTWFATVIPSADEEASKAAAEVKNFYCVQVEALTGRITSYRP